MYETYSGTLDDGEIPPVVYKYRDWNQPYHDRFIKNKEVYMAAPSSFEDEKDCKIPIRYDLLSEKQIIQWGVRLSKIKNPLFTRQQLRKDTREWAKQKLFKNKQHLESYKNYYFTEHDKRFGVLSLTAEPCLEEMWKKYANDSTGLCIGYNSRIMFEKLGGGGKVSYVEKLPTVFPEPIMSHFEIRSHQLFAKELKWEFEKEYRTHMFWSNPASINNRQINLPKEAYNKIILGKNISKKNKMEI